MHDLSAQPHAPAPTTPTRRRTRRRAKLALVSSAALLAAWLPGYSANGENGNITPGAIEIDANANLYPTPATGCTGNAFNAAPNTGVVDWVKDCLANNTLTVGTDAAAQKGHWNGFRILDGIAGADQDIFLTGGKENDTTTWNPGPGSVGSSKYDITQAYIANNTSDSFFGMERRGNNGTTAFDWEFNKLAPTDPTPLVLTDPLYIPNRSEDDVLVTFEMQGSGGSGSATPFRFRFDDPDVATGTVNPPADSDHDGTYVATTITGITSSINTTAVPSAPWGTVNSQGNWTTADVERFEFAEAKVPLSLLGISASDLCTNVSRFVQVRTRASSTPSSDLKDLTKIFNFDFFAPVNPTQTLNELCDAKFHFASSLSTGTTPSWKFEIADVGGVATGVTLAGVNPTVVSSPGSHPAGATKTTWTATAFNGDVQVNLPAGQDSVTIAVSQSVTDANQCDTGSTGSILVHRGLGVTASLTPHCGNAFDYSATPTGGVGTKTFAWSFQKSGANNSWTEVATRTGATGSIDMDLVDVDPNTAGIQPAGQGTYRGVVTVTDEALASTGKPACQATYTTTSVSVYNDISATASATPDCTSTFSWSSQVSGGKAPYDISVQVQKLVSGVWTDQGSATTFTDDADGAVSGSYDAAGSPGSYRIHVAASDDQTPACTTTQDSAAISVRDPLTATAAKQSADGTNLTVAMNGEHTNALAGDTVTYQWQYRIDGGAFVDLAGQTSEDFTYSTFNTQDTTPTAVTFSIASGDASGSYAGRVWAVDLRLHVTRTAGGVVCSIDSSAVTVKKLTAVDP